MNNKVLAAVLVAASFLAGGCTTLTDYGSVRKEILRNDQGHVVGYKELLRNDSTGEVIARVSMYSPIVDHDGALIGYEEVAKDGGTIIRDLDGRGIGGRFADLRSRGTNSKNRGLMIVMRPADSAKVAVSQPKLMAMMASLSPSDLRRIQ